MKKLAVLLCIGLVLVLTPNAIAASKITPGSTCKKVNQQAIYKNKIYTCIKLGKKLYWDNGAAYKIEKQSLIPAPTVSTKSSATPTPSQTKISTPAASPSTSQSIAVPLLRDSDITFFSGKLKIIWSGLDTSQKPLMDLRRINVWVFDLQSEKSLAGGLWRVACFITPTPGSFCEISLPPRDHAVRISAYYLNGSESGSSVTLRAKANPITSTLPTDVTPSWG